MSLRLNNKSFSCTRIKFTARALAYAFIFAVLLFTAPLTSCALPGTIWESSERSIITRGVTLEQNKRFTVDGWLSIDVIRVDLSDRNISLDALYNNAAIQDLTTVKVMAERQGAVAAINGGFFEWNAGWGGSAIGTAMRGGHIDTAFSETNAYGEVMASITVNALNEVLIDYCKPSITLKAGGAAGTSSELQVGSYNKKSFYEYRDISIHDRKWIQYSIGASSQRPDVVELVADNGIIKEIRVGMPAVEIPVGGFVAITRTDGNGKHAFAGPGFAIGEPVGFTASFAPNIEGAVMHIEGTSMLVRNGIIPGQFSYEPGSLSQRNPRTLVGCTEDGQELLLVTVDGRQASSIGMTSYESAELMLELGAYNALNMDGGGSTTLVARPAGEFGLALVNSVSDSSPRAVVNGIGVFTDAPKAAIRGLIIETADTNVFVGTHRQFTVKAYDRFYNPVKVSDADIAWSVSGFNGQINNGMLMPETSGAGQVRAKVGRATATIDVKALSTPSELILNSTSLTIRSGQTHTFAVIGRDRMGYSARINPADISWTASDSFGKINNGVFTRGSDISGYIAAACGNAIAYCAVQPVPRDAQAGQGTAAQVKLPPASRIADRANRPAEPGSAAGAAYSFGVLGNPALNAKAATAAQTAGRADGAAAAVNGAFTAVVNASLDGGIYVGAGPRPVTDSIKKPAYVTDSDFEVHRNFCGDPARTLIKLSSSGNGLRAAGSAQWGNFLSAIDVFTGNDLFIMVQQGPSTFADKLEAALFKQTLADVVRDKGCRVWVFYAGATDSVWIEDGVRYFTCAGPASAAVDQATGAGAKYLEVAVRGDEVTYEYKPLT